MSFERAIVIWPGLIQFFLASCGNLSTNQISRGSFALNNGHFNGQIVETELIFDRFAWFKEASLMYEVRVAPVSEQSPYFQWLSSHSQQNARECSRFYIALLYAKSSRYISHRMVLNQLIEQGAQVQTIPEFWRSLRMHPQFEGEALQRHRVSGLCFRGRNSSIVLGLPGYPTQVISE